VIRAVLIDAGGVMVLPHHERVTGVLRDLEIDVGADAAARAHYLGVAAIDRDPPGRAAAYLEAFATGIGVRPLDRAKAVRELQVLWSGPAIDLWSQVLDGTAEGLRTLAQRGHRLGVISNADGTVAEQLGRHELCQVGEGAGVEVEVVADSFVVGYAKPAPEIFHFALDVMGLRPSEALYIGDSVWSDVEGAESVGLTALHFDPLRLCESREHAHLASLLEVAGFVD
jgi:FMN phosphatase YigB (HAD superfamily)